MTRNIFIVTSFILGLLVHPSYSYAEQYRLGPQDRISIRVYDLRRSSSEAYPWTALNGEFSVSADGVISLPLIGEIAAGGLSTNEISKTISLRLKEKADLAEIPAASVEVVKYRPFYVLGSVQQPGKYDYIPGLTVLQALGVAQGLSRADDPSGSRKEILSLRGELDRLRAENILLQIKEARLEVEVSGGDNISFEKISAGSKLSFDVNERKQTEARLFKSRKTALTAENKAIDDASESYKQEVEALNQKIKALDSQIVLSKKDLDMVNELIAKGLTVSPRQVAAEQAQAGYQSAKLDAQVATLRAKQNLSRSVRDRIEIGARYMNQALEELKDARAKIEENNFKIQTNLKIISNLRSADVTDTGDASYTVSYEIVRTENASGSIKHANESDVLTPGDVLRVGIVGAQSGASGSGYDVEGRGNN